MKLKKWNAALSILTIFLLLIHEGYQLFAYITFYYNPTLSAVTGYAVIGCLGLHAILSAICVFTLHDSKVIVYKKLNLRTVIQRISAVLIVLLLPFHVLSFSLLQKSAGGVGYVLTEVVQIVFYASLMGHIALSFGNSLVTLGSLSDIKKKRILDLCMLVVCTILFITASVIVTKGHAIIFGKEG